MPSRYVADDLPPESHMRYPVTLSKDDNGTFLVRFADVPEAITYGDTKEQALAHAQDALLTAFDAYIKDRRDIPEPSQRGGVSIEVPALEASKIALYRAMRERSINKSELARRLHWHLPQVDRVLDVRHGSQIDQIESALAAVGKRLVVNVIDAEPKRMARFGAPGLRKTRRPRPMAAHYKRTAKKR